MTDIVERLRNPPEDTYHTSAILLMEEAADEIERLRSIAGKADVGPSFSELTDELRHQTPNENV